MAMTAGQVMRRSVVLVRDDAPLSECARLLADNRISGMPVVDARGALRGIVSQADVIRGWQDGGPHMTASPLVRDVMTRDPVCVPEDENVGALAALMLGRRIHRVLVTSAPGIIAGIVSTMDLVGLMGGAARDLEPRMEARSYSNLYSNRHERLLLRVEHIERIQAIQSAYAAKRMHAHADPLTISDVVNACLDAIFERPIPFAEARTPAVLASLIASELGGRTP